MTQPDELVSNEEIRNALIEVRKEYRELLRKGLAPASPEPHNHADTGIDICDDCEPKFKAEATVPYPENDLASQLSRALDAKTELEIRVARLEAMVNRVKAEHWNDDGLCDACRMLWPCPTLIGLSAERTSGE